MLLDRVDLFLVEFGSGRIVTAAHLRHARQRAEAAIGLVPPGTPGDLRHFGGRQAPLAHAVELRQRGEGDMADIEVQPHADGVGGDDVIDLARLEQLDLAVARFGTERAHHHRAAAAKPAQHFGHGVDLLGAEGDDRTARGRRDSLRRPGMGQRGETRPLDDFGFGLQRAHHRRQRGRAQQHRLFPPARMQQPVGEDMPAFPVRAELRLVQRHEGSGAGRRAAEFASRGMASAVQQK